MSKKRLYLIQRLENLLKLNEEFYNNHEDLKQHLISKINLLKLYDEVDVEVNNERV